MPQKLGKGGHGPQNYVPPGNSAGGQYGDNETGSNKHFTVFKKPDGSEGGISVRPNNEKNNENFNSFDEYIDKNFSNNENMQKGLKESFNAGTEEQQAKLNYFVSNGIIKIVETNGISNYSGAVELNSGHILHKGDFSKEKGDTMYHEFGHSYDELFAKGWVDKNTGKKIFDGLITAEDNKKLDERNGGSFYKSFLLRGQLSTNKYLSNNKTLFETLTDEGRKMTRDGRWDQIIKDYGQAKKDAVIAKIPDYYEKNKEYDTLKNALWNEARDKFPYNSGEWNEISKLRNDYVDAKLNSPENIKLKEYVTNATFEVTKIESKVLKQYSNLSDMYGIYKKIPYGFGCGHKGNYSTRLPGAMAMEFFAEYNSALARNDTKQIELYKKYMPESIKAAEELFSIMDKAWKGFKK